MRRDVTCPVRVTGPKGMTGKMPDLFCEGDRSTEKEKRCYLSCEGDRSQGNDR
jgi:hypothetical protein